MPRTEKARSINPPAALRATMMNLVKMCLHLNATEKEACGREASRMYGTFVRGSAFAEAANRPHI